MTPPALLPISMRWESDVRYYVAVLGWDLFGTLEVRLMWGGRYNGMGGQKVVVVGDLDEGQAILREIARERERHGYRIVRAG